MADQSKPPPPPKDDKAARLAAALKANLKRRKAERTSRETEEGER
jgi:hypothetical protein